MKKICLILFAFSLVLSLVSCEKDKDVVLVVVSVSNEQVLPTYTSATISSVISSKVLISQAFVHYTTSKDFASYEEVQMQEKDGQYTAELVGLQENSTYYYRYAVANRYSSLVIETVNEFSTLKPVAPLVATFSVSESKQVYFSKGNLQYTQSTNTWSFAENQYDYIGTDNVTGGSVSSDPNKGDRKEGTALADKVDLFGWSTNATNFGVSTSEDWENGYSGSFIDWGTNKIGNDAPNTWRTLTYEEWNYLRNSRTNANDLCGVAQVNGVNGIIFLPDNWTCPAGVTFKSGSHSSDGVDYYAAYQTFTADQWSKLEESGAVFLPAAGYRYGSIVHYVQLYGNYWSATERGSDGAYYLDCSSGGANMNYDNRAGSISVRLVKDLQ